MQRDSKIYICGHKGMVGSAIARNLRAAGYVNLLLRSSDELDLRNQRAVKDFMFQHRPEYVFLAAAKVGGIKANSDFPVDFIYDNLMIETNVIRFSYEVGVKKLLYLGSSCIYPRDCPNPIKEEYLLSGKLEYTNEAYAIAKIAGIKLCQAYNRQYRTNYISLMPTNLYGINDNFDLEFSHVAPALIRRFHEAKVEGAEQVVVWGTGNPRREFMYVDDLADACVYLMNRYNESDIINVGVGKDISISVFASLVKEIVGYNGRVVFDASKPDGTPRKLLAVSRLNNLGWSATTKLRDGIAVTYEWYKKNG